MTMTLCGNSVARKAMVSGIGRLGVKIHGLRCVNIHKWGGMLKFSLVVKGCGASGILFGVREVAAIYHWPAHRAGLLRCNFFYQPGSVSKCPPFLWVKLWVGWVGRGYIEISRYFPALWINRVTLVTKIKLWYSLGYQITFESPKCLYGMLFCVSKPDSIFSVYHSSPSSHVRSSLIGWSFILGNTDCNTVPTWWM